QPEKDPEISLLCNRALSEEEAEKVPVCYFRRSGVLMRKWRPPDVSPEEDWKVVNQIVIKQYKSSAYHPESQGALERFHQTLKNMMRSYCFENKRDWDEGIHMLLFGVRESVQESLGFSPFELVFGHT
ncbi:hypothetical protein ScPMuIL_000287, partial [Solemya velum]